MRPHPVLSSALAERRRRLLARARGRVADVGGFADNCAHYPAGVSVHDVATDELASLPDDSFDTVVCTLVLCTFTDLGAALADVRRVMAPDALLLFIEHVPGGRAWWLVQRIAAPGWSRLFGCHPDRDTVAAVRDAGLFITDLDRFHFSAAVPVLSPGAQGIAKVAA